MSRLGRIASCDETFLATSAPCHHVPYGRFHAFPVRRRRTGNAWNRPYGTWWHGALVARNVSSQDAMRPNRDIRREGGYGHVTSPVTVGSRSGRRALSP